MPRPIVVAFFALMGCATSPEPAPASTPPASTSTPPAATTPALAGPATVIALVRHAEKATTGSADPPLHDAGKARAGCLADMLEPFAPTSLWATQLQRTQSTLAPLAQRLGTSVETIAATDLDGWTARLAALPAGSRAVAALHSNTIPPIVRALGGDPGPLDDKGNIPETEYDRIVFVVLAGDGAQVVTFRHRYCMAPPV